MIWHPVPLSYPSLMTYVYQLVSDLIAAKRVSGLHSAKLSSLLAIRAHPRAALRLCPSTDQSLHQSRRC